MIDKIEYFWGTKKTPPKDPNSSSALRGYEKRLAHLEVKGDLTHPRVIKEIKKIKEKIDIQKMLIEQRKQNG